MAVGHQSGSGLALIVGTGLRAVPGLAGSAAYAIGEARKWPVRLARQPLEEGVLRHTRHRRRWSAWA